MAAILSFQTLADIPLSTASAVAGDSGTTTFGSAIPWSQDVTSTITVENSTNVSWPLQRGGTYQSEIVAPNTIGADSEATIEIDVGAWNDSTISAPGDDSGYVDYSTEGIPYVASFQGSQQLSCGTDNSLSAVNWAFDGITASTSTMVAADDQNHCAHRLSASSMTVGDPAIDIESGSYQSSSGNGTFGPSNFDLVGVDPWTNGDFWGGGGSISGDILPDPTNSGQYPYAITDMLVAAPASCNIGTAVTITGTLLEHGGDSTTFSLPGTITAFNPYTDTTTIDASGPYAGSQQVSMEIVIPGD